MVKERGGFKAQNAGRRGRDLRGFFVRSTGKHRGGLVVLYKLSLILPNVDRRSHGGG
jgi:hypothetical protein